MKIYFFESCQNHFDIRNNKLLIDYPISYSSTIIYYSLYESDIFNIIKNEAIKQIPFKYYDNLIIAKKYNKYCFFFIKRDVEIDDIYYSEKYNNLYKKYISLKAFQ